MSLPSIQMHWFEYSHKYLLLYTVKLGHQATQTPSFGPCVFLPNLPSGKTTMDVVGSSFVTHAHTVENLAH